MHSSRMHTVRCSGRLGREGVCPGGCMPREGVCLGGGVCLVGNLPKGVSVWGGVNLPLWTEFLTDTCENITLPQLLLRTVIKHLREHHNHIFT